MSIRVLVSAALMIALLSVLCIASKPEDICFVKRCCYRYEVCVPVVRKVKTEYQCKYRKCDPKCENKEVVEKHCRNVKQGIHGIKKHCEDRTVTREACHDVCVTSEALCVKYELKSFPKYCPKLHCSGAKPDDFIEKQGTLVKTEKKTVPPRITPAAES